METWVQTSIHASLAALALPTVGLPAVFLISLVSATLLPLGSEPAVFAYVQLAPHMFWPAIVVATIGNTAGGAITYAMGAGAESAYQAWSDRHHATGMPQAGTSPDTTGSSGERRASAAGGRWHDLTASWFRRFGPPALLLSWLPVVGDPLCAVAGWLKLPFWRCTLYMAIGKCLRYIAMTTVLIHAWPQVSQWL
ncbi:MAG: DedA family protein [Castellaniella sp.]|uniref:YqaA family protein n=1 Tax=Castellaniella sp. TaxID=1955812 RepID=UPI0011F6CC83|nr:YqaA family protein [Castellaniella sp.]TAN28213.1 MAG: DedA family protein [Castellaniella sp.]